MEYVAIEKSEYEQLLGTIHLGMVELIQILSKGYVTRIYTTPCIGGNNIDSEFVKTK